MAISKPENLSSMQFLTRGIIYKFKLPIISCATIYFCLLVFLPVACVKAQAPSISYPSPGIYKVNTPINNLDPVNSGGPVIGKGYGQVSTIAGGQFEGFQDGQGRNARFSHPAQITHDKEGNFYVTDAFNNSIRKITPAGMVTTLAGSIQGDQDGPGHQARLSFPVGITIDQNNNLYVADYFNNKIKIINPSGMVNTFAGNGTNTETPGPRLIAGIASPSGLARDHDGNFYFSTYAQTIRRIDQTGNVSTIAGGGVGYADGVGATAKFHNALGPAMGPDNDIYVADESNQRVRRISRNGNTTTIAGTGEIGFNNGPAATATFNFPGGVALDSSGNIYVADEFNHAIRKISADGSVSTVAGNGLAGQQDGERDSAQFNVPTGLTLDGDGNLIIVDSFNAAIRKISLNGYMISAPLPAGLKFDSETGRILGTPTETWPKTEYLITAFNAYGSSATKIYLQVDPNPLLPSIITFPEPIVAPDAQGNFVLEAVSTNKQTQIIYTSSNPKVATILPNGMVHIEGPGKATIVATQDGNENYFQAMPVSKDITILFKQVLAIPEIPDKLVCDLPFSLNAISNNKDNGILYQSSDEGIASVDATGIVTIHRIGEVSITVTQPATK